MNKTAVASLMFCLSLVAVGCGGHGDGHLSDHGHDHDEGDGHDHGEHDDHGDHDGAVTATATLAPTSGSEVTGTATFTASDGQVTLALELAGCPPGEHAFHIHEVGDCSAPDGTSAGGHWNPGGSDHGKWGQAPFHLGDIGNITIGEDGTGSMVLTTDVWSVRSGEDNDVVGRSVIVHAAADDFETQPTGAAGGRIACGVIE